MKKKKRAKIEAIEDMRACGLNPELLLQEHLIKNQPVLTIRVG